MDEVVRGGIQSLTKSQYEAAKTLGMGNWRMNLFIILTQALKLVIPGITNTFIALFKDTPLIAIVGLLELVGMIDLAKTNPKWLGFAAEGYVFAALVYFVFCYSMSARIILFSSSSESLLFRIRRPTKSLTNMRYLVSLVTTNWSFNVSLIFSGLYVTRNGTIVISSWCGAEP